MTKKSKKVNYGAMSLEELNKKLKDFKMELFNLRFQQVVNQLENPSRVRTVKREIARIFTVMNDPKRKVSS